MGSLHHIEGVEIIDQSGVNPDCVECLEELLSKAKGGEIVGVTVAAQYADGSTTGHTHGFIRSTRVVGEMMLLISGLTR
jgi:hypothetical protein